jgi:hypothetical protein
MPEVTWALFSLVLLAAGLVKAYLPASAAYMPHCFLRVYVGVRCPTCGTGTALQHLARGELWDAVRSNWLAPAMVAALLAFDLYLAGTLVARRRLEVTLTRRDSWVVAGVAFLALGLAWVFQAR